MQHENPFKPSFIHNVSIPFWIFPLIIFVQISDTTADLLSWPAQLIADLPNKFCLHFEPTADLYVYGTKQFCSFTEFLFFVDFRIPCPNSPMHASEAFPNAFSHHGAATPDGTALLFLPITATQTQKNWKRVVIFHLLAWNTFIISTFNLSRLA